MANVRTATRPRTLAIDIGGSGLKMLLLGPLGEPLNDRLRRPTPESATPGAILAELSEMIALQPTFDRIAAGFPGVVDNGVTLTAANLHPDWIGFDLAGALHALTGKPTRLANDADVQGLAVIEGVGVELVLTLGTGLGSALYTDCRLVPNLEIAHHVFRKNRTYEEYLGNAARKRGGTAKWNVRLAEALALLRRTFNFRHLYLGGGNTRKIRLELPEYVSIVPNVAGLIGGIRLWDSEAEAGPAIEAGAGSAVQGALEAQ